MANTCMWQRSPFEILYLHQRASIVTLRREKKKIYIYIYECIEIALIFNVTKDPRRQSATSKPQLPSHLLRL